MTRDWSNTPANAGTTEESRSQMRSLESAVATSIGTRHESYSLTFAGFTAGVAPLFTLQVGEAVTQCWGVVTTAFDGTELPESATIVATAAPTYANNLSGSLCDPHSVTSKIASNAVYQPSSDSTVFTPVSAAVPLSLLLTDGVGLHAASVGSTTGAMTVHVIITTTA